MLRCLDTSGLVHTLLLGQGGWSEGKVSSVATGVGLCSEGKGLLSSALLLDIGVDMDGAGGAGELKGNLQECEREPPSIHHLVAFLFLRLLARFWGTIHLEFYLIMKGGLGRCPVMPHF